MDGNNWIQIADIDGEVGSDNSGISVSLTSDGEKVAIGANNNDGSGGNAIHVRVFDILGSLPVELMNFNGELHKSKVRLSWSTYSEEDSDFFEIEHSTNGTEFTPLNKISAAGTSTQQKHYIFQHNDPQIGLNYYRLKQVDIDGSSEYSNIISVSMNSNRVIIYPNPTSDLLYISGLEDKNIKIQVYDNYGKLIKSSTGKISEVDISFLPSGIYLVRIETDIQNIEKRIFIK